MIERISSVGDDVMKLRISFVFSLFLIAVRALRLPPKGDASVSYSVLEARLRSGAGERILSRALVLGFAPAATAILVVSGTSSLPPPRRSCSRSCIPYRAR